jgi:ABC-type bacteriocin/lantibiotic exporter with double-glycine peptidase domain
MNHYFKSRCLFALENNSILFEILRKVEHDHTMEISKKLMNQTKNLYSRQQIQRIDDQKINKIIYYSWIFLTFIL